MTNRYFSHNKEKFYGKAMKDDTSLRREDMIIQSKCGIRQGYYDLSKEHILDEDRKKNAELFEETFYEKENLDPQMHPNTAENTVAVPKGVDAELLAKVLSNPEMAALLTSLAKTMK